VTSLTSALQLLVIARPACSSASSPPPPSSEPRATNTTIVGQQLRGLADVGLLLPSLWSGSCLARLRRMELQRASSPVQSRQVVFTPPAQHSDLPPPKVEPKNGSGWGRRKQQVARVRRGVRGGTARQRSGGCGGPAQGAARQRHPKPPRDSASDGRTCSPSSSSFSLLNKTRAAAPTCWVTSTSSGLLRRHFSSFSLRHFFLTFQEC